MSSIRKLLNEKPLTAHLLAVPKLIIGETACLLNSTYLEDKSNERILII
jgi:hypothetical protein